MQRLEGDYMVQPVVKAMQVLDYVASRGHMVNLTEIVPGLNLPKATVFRYLRTLSATGFLDHDIPHDRYGVGGRFRDLARVDSALSALREVARPEMRGLVETFEEAASLGILSDGQIVCIDILNPMRPPRNRSRIGCRHPLHTTALGKAILAFHADGLGLLDVEALPQPTFRTITSATKLRRQIDDIRHCGYALELGENEDELAGVAVAVLDGAGHPVGAIGLSVPVRRWTPAIAARPRRRSGQPRVRMARQLDVELATDQLLISSGET